MILYVAGTYSTTTGAANSTTCLPCPVVTYSETTGLNSSSLCIECVAPILAQRYRARELDAHRHSGDNPTAEAPTQTALGRGEPRTTRRPPMTYTPKDVRYTKYHQKLRQAEEQQVLRQAVTSELRAVGIQPDKQAMLLTRVPAYQARHAASASRLRADAIIGSTFESDGRRWLVTDLAPSAQDGRIVAYACDLAKRIQSTGKLSDHTREFDPRDVRRYVEAQSASDGAGTDAARAASSQPGGSNDFEVPTEARPYQAPAAQADDFLRCFSAAPQPPPWTSPPMPPGGPRPPPLPQQPQRPRQPLPRPPVPQGQPPIRPTPPTLTAQDAIDRALSHGLDDLHQAVGLPRGATA